MRRAIFGTVARLFVDGCNLCQPHVPYLGTKQNNQKYQQAVTLLRSKAAAFWLLFTD